MTIAHAIKRSRLDKESWRYTDLESLLNRPFSSNSKHEAIPSISSARPCLVFKNGFYQASQSNASWIEVVPLETDANGYRLSVRSSTDPSSKDLELVFVTDGDQEETSLRLEIHMAPNSHLRLVEKHLNEISASTFNLDMIVDLGAEASLYHCRFLSHALKARLFHTLIHVGHKASYQNLSLIKNNPLVRNDLHVTLKDKEAFCSLNGIMLLRAEEHADSTIGVTHAASHGTSRQYYKSILTDKGRGVFQGRITVAEQAQKTDATQLNRALLLSDQAEMDAKPELKIYADDVSCSHGCTIGDIDPDTLFYLRTRGLSEIEARALLLRAFIGDILESIPFDHEKERASQEAERWFYEHQL